MLLLAQASNGPLFGQSAVTLDQLLSKDAQIKLGVAAMKPEQQELLKQVLITLYAQGYQAGNAQGYQTGKRDGALALSAPPEPSGVIESRIDGDFNGWEGETVVKLVNGQIWQQSSYRYEYHYAFMPDVMVYPSAGGYKMKVDGVSEAVDVRRLR